MGCTTDEKVHPSETCARYVQWGTFWRVVCTMFKINSVSANTAGIRVLMDNIDIGWGSFFYDVPYCSQLCLT